MENEPKHLFWLIVASTLFALFSLVSLVIFTNPQSAGFLTFTSLYFSLFLSSLGIFTITGLAVRRKFFSGLYSVNLKNSFRQAMLLSLLVVCWLLLSAQGLLYWWVVATLILFLGFVEAFFNF